jgi:PAS domain S-box-containing protein
MQTGKVFKNVTMGIFNLQLNRYIWIKISAIPLFRQNEGMPYQVYTIFEDITTEKNLEKTVQNWHDQAVLLTQFLENSIQPFGISYLDGTLWYVNQALARLLQSSVEDISMSANMGAGSSPNWLKIELEDIQIKGKSQKQGKVFRNLLRKDGVEILVEIFANLISDETGEPVYYYLLINEITSVRKVSDPE